MPARAGEDILERGAIVGSQRVGNRSDLMSVYVRGVVASACMFVGESDGPPYPQGYVTLRGLYSGVRVA